MANKLFKLSLGLLSFVGLAKAATLQPEARTPMAVTVPQNGNVVGVTINQNDTNNNPCALSTNGKICATGAAVFTGAGLSTCGDATHALGYNASSQFTCQNVTGSGGGGGVSGQINNANQNDMSYYSVAGSSNVLSGIDNFTWNGSTLTHNVWNNFPVTSTISVYGVFQASGSVGNVGQILASNGPGLPPTFIDPVVSQTTDSNLNASVSIKGSSNTVQVTGTVTTNVIQSTVGVIGAGTLTTNVIQSTVGAAQNGTWTVQPGNTANTTAWLVQSSSFGANASTVAVTNPAGNSLTVNITSGSISNSGFNVNNTPTVNPGNTQNTVPWNTQSTYTVVTDTWSLPVTATVNSGPISIVTVAGSTITVGYQSGLSSVPVQVQNTVTANVIQSTIAAQQNGTWTVQPGNTQNTTAWLVQASSFGANASTVAVTNPAGNSLTVNITSGSISNTGFNVNNTVTANVIQSTIAAQQNGTWTVQPGNTQNTVPWNTQSTYTVVTDTWNVNVNVAAATTLTTNVIQSTVGVVGTLAADGVAAGTNRLPTLPGIAQNLPGNNGSALTQGRNEPQLILTKSGLLGTWSGPDITYNGYSASTGTYSVNNTTQDVAGLCGNGTTTLYVYRVTAACTQTTAGIIPIAITKRSSAYTGSWSSATAVLQDSNYAAYISTPVFNFGQNATNGTLIGYVDFGQVGCMAAGTATPNDIYISPSDWRMKPIVLRGTAQCLGINFQGATITGGKYSFGYEWLELSTSP